MAKNCPPTAPGTHDKAVYMNLLSEWEYHSGSLAEHIAKMVFDAWVAFGKDKEHPVVKHLLKAMQHATSASVASLSMQEDLHDDKITPPPMLLDPPQVKKGD